MTAPLGWLGELGSPGPETDLRQIRNAARLGQNIPVLEVKP